MTTAEVSRQGNVSATAASATINRFSIGGSLVPLAAFRQLLSGGLIQQDGSFAGLPWGTVNYHEKECHRRGPHHHVVWQLGDDLRQDIVEPPRWTPFGSTTCDEVIFAAGSFLKITWTRFRWAPPEFCRRGSGGKLFFDVDGLRCVAALPRHLGVMVDEGELVAHRDIQVVYLSLVQTLHAEVHEEKQRRARVEARWQETVQLRQLFIAV